jgi:hypothetical protein
MVAPMSLISFDEVRPWAKSIARVVESGEMPPWHASSEQRGVFEDERYLTDAQKETILRWVAAGAPAGDVTEAPVPVEFPSDDGWHIGKPDLVLKMPVEYCVPDEVEDEYQYFNQTLTADLLPENRFLKAVEFRPSGKFVHHIIARPLGGIAPGYQPKIFPEGHAALLRTGTTIRWQMHYHKEPGPGTGVCDTDTYVAMRFYQPGEVITHLSQGDSMGNTRFRIPPGDPSYTQQIPFTFEEDAYVMAFNPHMHLRGKAARVVATFPDGREELLLDVPRYDFDWQHNYNFKEPVFAPTGTKLLLTLQWDNSPENPANPDPTATVTFGQPTTAEMGFGFMKYVRAEPMHVVVGSDEARRLASAGVEQDELEGDL